MSKSDITTTSALIHVSQHAIDGQTVQTVNARELHAFLGPKARFNDWIARRMTLEEFILKNGLFRQFPPTMWRSIAPWLLDFCQTYRLKVEKAPTPGKYWPDENSYPIRALAAWLDQELRKPRQIALVETDRHGNSVTSDPAEGYTPRRRGRKAGV